MKYNCSHYQIFLFVEIERMKDKKKISDIDDYTLFEVFRHLDSDSLLKSTEVCQK